MLLMDLIRHHIWLNDIHVNYSRLHRGWCIDCCINHQSMIQSINQSINPSMFYPRWMEISEEADIVSWRRRVTWCDCCFHHEMYFLMRVGGVYFERLLVETKSNINLYLAREEIQLAWPKDFNQRGVSTSEQNQLRMENHTYTKYWHGVWTNSWASRLLAAVQGRYPL